MFLHIDKVHLTNINLNLYPTIKGFTSSIFSPVYWQNSSMVIN